MTHSYAEHDSHVYVMRFTQICEAICLDSWQAEAAKAMTEREKDLRKRLEHACVQLNQA